MLFVVEYVLLHFDHFKQACYFGLLQFLVTFQDFNQPRTGTRSTLGLEREQIWSLSRERSTLLFPTVSSSQLSFPPVLWKEKGNMSGSPQRAAGCVQKPGAGRQSAHLEVAGPWQQASFQKGKDRENTKNNQNNTAIPGVKWSTSLLLLWWDRARQDVEGGRGCLVFGRQMELRQKDKSSGTRPSLKGHCRGFFRKDQCTWHSCVLSNYLV